MDPAGGGKPMALEMRISEASQNQDMAFWKGKGAQDDVQVPRFFLTQFWQAALAVL
jgi:hypothetical protein